MPTRQDLLAEARRRGLVNDSVADFHVADTPANDPSYDTTYSNRQGFDPVDGGSDIPNIDDLQTATSYPESELLEEAKRRGLFGKRSTVSTPAQTQLRTTQSVPEISQIPTPVADRTNVVSGPEQPGLLERSLSKAYENRPRLANAFGVEEGFLSQYAPRFERTGIAPIDFAEVAIEGAVGFPLQAIEDPIGATVDFAGLPGEFVKSGYEAYRPGQTPEEQAENKSIFAEHIAGAGAMVLGGTLASRAGGVNAIGEFSRARNAKAFEAAKVERANLTAEARLGFNDRQNALIKQSETFTRPTDPNIAIGEGLIGQAENHLVIRPR